LRQSALAAVAKHEHYRSNGVIGPLDVERFNRAIDEACAILAKGKIDPAPTPPGFDTTS